MSDDRRLEWVASVGCDGGPVLVVDRGGFAQWTGAEPFARIASRDPAMGERSHTLHYWGQFSHRLPAPFTADGGHQYVQCASGAEAKIKLAELRQAVTTAFPEVRIWTEGAQTHFQLPANGGGAPRMTAQLSPVSEYDASWQSHAGSESWLYSFGQGAEGLFWDLEGAGVAEVGVRPDEVVLVRSWPSGDEPEETELAAIHALVSRVDPEEAVVGELTLAGRTVIVWGPMAMPVLAQPEVLDGAGPARLDAGRAGGDGIGAAIDVTPGRYRITTWSTDESELDEPWSCRWCRLTRIA